MKRAKQRDPRVFSKWAWIRECIHSIHSMPFVHIEQYTESPTFTDQYKREIGFVEGFKFYNNEVSK